MHFMFPHVFSTQTKSDTKTTMGFTCNQQQHYHQQQQQLQRRRRRRHQQHQQWQQYQQQYPKCHPKFNSGCTNNLIKSRTTTITITTTATESTNIPATVQSNNKCWWWWWWYATLCCRNRIQFIFKLLWKFKWQQQQQLERKCQYVRQSQQFNNNNSSDIDHIHKHQSFISIILCISQKTERTTNTDIVPSSRTWCRIRWTGYQLCIGAAESNRWRRTTCDCLSFMEMGRPCRIRRTETDTIVSKRNGPDLCLLQSNTLVSHMPIRYAYSFYFFYLFRGKFHFRVCISINLEIQ